MGSPARELAHNSPGTGAGDETMTTTNETINPGILLTAAVDSIGD